MKITEAALSDYCLTSKKKMGFPHMFRAYMYRYSHFALLTLDSTSMWILHTWVIKIFFWH